MQTSVWFNPNTSSQWFFAITNIVGFTFLLAVLLVGAAIIREKERGTIEHLLVMPVSANQIALSKILSNGVVIAVSMYLSLIFVVQGCLVQINGSIALYMLGTAIFLFRRLPWECRCYISAHLATVWAIDVAYLCGIAVDIRRDAPFESMLTGAANFTVFFRYPICSTV